MSGGGVRVRDLILPQQPKAEATVRIYGERLVVHNWHAKGMKELGKTEKKAANKKGLRVAKEEFEAARYVDIDGRHGIPVTGMKNAIVSAGLLADDISKAALRRSLFIQANSIEHNGRNELLLLEYDKCQMREDITRLSGVSRSPAIRWRPEYLNWSVTFTATYSTLVLSTEQFMHLIILAGDSIGLCEGRQEKCSLGWGRFDLDLDASVVREPERRSRVEFVKDAAE